MLHHSPSGIVSIRLTRGCMSDDDELLRTMKRTGGRALLGLAGVLVIAPFMLHFSINGLDYIKLCGGALACVLALAAIASSFRSRGGRAQTVGLAVLVLAGGGFHLATSGAVGGLSLGGGSEDDARAWLEERGGEILSLAPDQDGSGYEYTIWRDGARCTGTLHISRGLTETSTSHVETCGGRATDDQFRRECALGSASSCQELGLRIADTNPAEALAYFRRGCERNLAPACTNAAVTLQHMGHDDEAITMSQRACDMGDPIGCGNLGLFLLHMEGRVISPELAQQAKTYLELACAGGHHISCGKLAWEVSFGRVLEHDEVRARSLFDGACEAHVFSSCADLAILVRGGRGGPPDDARALMLATRACEGGHFPLSCRMQGELEEARGPGFNLAAVDAFKTACALEEVSRDVAGACVQAGLHLYGRADPKPLQEIAALWTRACDRDDADGCRNMGVIHRDGELGPPEADTTISFFQRACNLGYEPACRERGVIPPR